MKRQALICDLDGTLTNCKHRRHLVEGDAKNWTMFFEKAGDDPVNEFVAQAVFLFCRWGGFTPWFLTGRPERYRAATMAWLTQHVGGLATPRTLLMRGDDDRRPDHEMKLAKFYELIAPEHDRILVLEDRAAVVAAWRSIGIECWQVAEGNF